MFLIKHLTYCTFKSLTADVSHPTVPGLRLYTFHFIERSKFFPAKSLSSVLVNLSSIKFSRYSLNRSLILLSASSALNNYGPRHNVVHSPVVLEEEEGDKDREEEGNGEVLVQRPHSRAVKIERDEAKYELKQGLTESHTDALKELETTNNILFFLLFNKYKNNSTGEKNNIKSVKTHAEKDTLDAGTTRTQLGRIRVDVSHVTTRKPSRNFPGVAPPAPQIQMI